jgi:ubiquinone/menaquinone biosynthesis C-methylase UbiE
MGWRDTVRSAFGRGVFPHQFWFLLETPGRRWLQPPEQLARRLQLSPDSRVLEIGPGSGFFSVAVAAGIPEGHLALLDLQSEFLERARRKLAKAGLHNFGCIPGNACELPFPDCDFDVVMMVSVLGEVRDRGKCLREVFRVLKPGGLLSVTEQRLDPDFIPSGQLRELVGDAGLEHVETWGPPRGYTANFRRPV